MEMSISIRKLIILAATGTVCAAASFGQLALPGGTSGGRMFAGETLKYEGKINKILRGITVADLTFSAAPVAGTDELVIKSEAVSKGTLLWLIRYSFVQRYESL